MAIRGVENPVVSEYIEGFWNNGNNLSIEYGLKDLEMTPSEREVLGSMKVLSRLLRVVLKGDIDDQGRVDVVVFIANAQENIGMNPIYLSAISKQIKFTELMEGNK